MSNFETAEKMAVSYSIKGETMKRFFTNLCVVLASIMLIVAMLVISIETFAFNRGFFEKEYDKIGTAQDIGISTADLTGVTDVLLDYTQDKRDTLDVQASIEGQIQEVFGEREKEHMVDVKALYIAARNVRTICLIAAPILILIAFLISRKKAIKALCRSFLYTSGAFLVLVVAIGLYAVIDFTAFWTAFHQVFFTNDLWLLNPNTDVLIMMVPEQFFFDLVTRIIIRFVSIFAVFNIAAIVGLKLYRKRLKKAVE
jgi:integral membrane protein (TIGR01906 family)